MKQDSCDVLLSKNQNREIYNQLAVISSLLKDEENHEMFTNIQSDIQELLTLPTEDKIVSHAVGIINDSYYHIILLLTRQ